VTVCWVMPSPPAGHLPAPGVGRLQQPGEGRRGGLGGRRAPPGSCPSLERAGGRPWHQGGGWWARAERGAGAVVVVREFVQGGGEGSHRRPRGVLPPALEAAWRGAVAASLGQAGVKA